jgi:hypothetical protein
LTRFSLGTIVRVAHSVGEKEIVMAAKIPDDVSVRVVAEVTDAIDAALGSDPETSALAPTWQAMRDKTDGLWKARGDCGRAATRARARLAVCDAKWDRTVAAFGRAMVDASGGRRDQPPYTRFFAKATPSAAQKFGIAREIDIGREWLVELARNPAEPLAQAWTARLAEATDALAMAFNQRNDTVKAQGPVQTSVALLIDDVNRELDRLEGDLKKLFPGQPDRVGSYTAVTRHSRPAGSDEPEPAPAPAPAPGTN